VARLAVVHDEDDAELLAELDGAAEDDWVPETGHPWAL
jgi:hypothetical protein